MIILVTKKENFVISSKIICKEYNADILKYLNSFDILSYDSETSGLDCHTNKLFCIQLGTPEHQFVIDVRYVDINLFKDILQNKCLLGVNLKFDLKFLFKLNIRPTKVIDLMLNEINLTNGLLNISETKGAFSFKGLSLKYLNDDEIDKTVGASFTVKKFDEPLREKEIIYSAKDVENPIKIYEKQKESIKEKYLERLCDFENKFTISLADIEYNGISLDLKRWGDIRKNVDLKLTDIDRELNNILIENLIFSNKKIKIGNSYKPIIVEYENQNGDYIKKCLVNWASPSQVTSIFNISGEKLNSIDKANLQALQGTNPLIDTYIQRSKYNSLKSKFTDVIETFINKSTGKIHTDFWQIVSTGRLSSNHPKILGVYTAMYKMNSVNCWKPFIFWAISSQAL